MIYISIKSGRLTSSTQSTQSTQSTPHISPGMTQLWVLALLIGVTSSLKHVEQREIKTSDGQIFNCFYTINYNAKGRAGII